MLFQVADLKTSSLTANLFKEVAAGGGIYQQDLNSQDVKLLCKKGCLI